MTIVVVANPHSGRGRGARLIPQVDALLRSLDVDYRLQVSLSPSDPERMAREAASGGCDIVAALGGDGHAGACANGIAGSGTALALIPTGTGNDFTRPLGLDRKDPLAAARLLASPVIRRIDLAHVSTAERERHYLNVAGAGFDSEVNAHANRVRLLGGTLKYVFSTFVTLARFRPEKVRLGIDGEDHSGSAMLIAVANGTSYGGGMLVCPHARLDDGALDICVIAEVSRWEFLRTFPKVFKGRHVEHPAVRMLRGQKVEISADRPFLVYADGEFVGSIPATFTIWPEALPVVVPPRKDDT